MNKNNAPRIPNSKTYWTNRGKVGKKVMLYFHDDMDGIFSAILMKNYLEKKDFEIYGYGVVNYQDSWNTIQLSKKLINVAVDFSENHKDIDIYIDHHEDIDNNISTTKQYAIKTNTTSAYEGILLQLGLPIDNLTRNVIELIDSAKYEEYNINSDFILNFDFKKFKNKLEFATSFNQLLKRSEHKTFIEVVANSKDITPSIYNIFLLFKKLYPKNNYNIYKLKGYSQHNGFNNVEDYIKFLKINDPLFLSKFEKDFIEDGKYKTSKMLEKTNGNGIKQTYYNQKDFIKNYKFSNQINTNGFQIIGNLVFVPNGSWANAIKTRAILNLELNKILPYKDKNNIEQIPTQNYIISEDSPIYDKLYSYIGKKISLKHKINVIDGFKYIYVDDINNKNIIGLEGIIEIKNKKLFFRSKQEIFWILLQYGNTFQIASYHDINKYNKDNLPKLKNGIVVSNLAKYCKSLLDNMVDNLDYNINFVEHKKTLSGGHKGIGTITNIFGRVPKNNKYYPDIRYIDLFKNKIINDLSGVDWSDLKLGWGDYSIDIPPTLKNMKINEKVILSKNIELL